MATATGGITGGITMAAPKKPRATKRNFAAMIESLSVWAKMYSDILAKVGGDAPTEFNKGQRDVLRDVLEKLESK